MNLFIITAICAMFISVAWFIKALWETMLNDDRQNKKRERRIRAIETIVQPTLQKISKKASKKTPKTPATPTAITLKPKNNQSCPLCREVIDSCIYYCDQCQSLYHIDCLEEMTKGTCPTIGCGYRFLSAPGSIEGIKC